MSDTPPQKKFGFPLLMFAGFCVGAVGATAVAFALSAQSGHFRYEPFFRILASAGVLGAYVGHVIGAARDPSAGYKPFGPINTSVLGTGAAIVLVGTVIVLAAVMGIMTLVKGGPPPH